VKLKVTLILITSLLLCLAVSGIVLGEPDVEKTTLTITSDPSGADIIINGKEIGKQTPHTLENLQPGQQLELVLKKPPLFKKSVPKKVTIKPGKNDVFVAIPETWYYYMWLYLPTLLKAAGMTLFLTIIAVFNGIIIGTLTGIARVVHNKILNTIAGIYVDFTRGTPLLVQIFMIHFGTPPIIGHLMGTGNPIPINPFVSALLALSINSGAYVAEIIRAGIQSIDIGQMEAARSLGMTYRQAMRFVILPQALKRVIPPLGNEFIAMLKDSSLVSVIGMEELVRRAQVIVTRTYRPTETWIEVGLIFLLMTIPFTRLVAYLERRLKTSD